MNDFLDQSAKRFDEKFKPPERIAARRTEDHMPFGTTRDIKAFLRSEQIAAYEKGKVDHHRSYCPTEHTWDAKGQVDEMLEAYNQGLADGKAALQDTLIPRK